MTTIFLLGVPVTLRPIALLCGVPSTLITALVARDNRVLLAAGAGALWYVADTTHTIGHIISSRAVDAPIDAVDFGIYPKTVYYNNDVSPQQHIGRASGGLIASLLTALVFALVAWLLPQGVARKLLTIAAIQNAIVLVGGMLPIPMVDGGVIFANVRKLNA